MRARDAVTQCSTRKNFYISSCNSGTHASYIFLTVWARTAAANPSVYETFVEIDFSQPSHRGGYLVWGIYIHGLPYRGAEVSCHEYKNFVMSREIKPRAPYVVVLLGYNKTLCAIRFYTSLDLFMQDLLLLREIIGEIKMDYCAHYYFTTPQSQHNGTLTYNYHSWRFWNLALYSFKLILEKNNFNLGVRSNFEPLQISMFRITF